MIRVCHVSDLHFSADPANNDKPRALLQAVRQHLAQFDERWCLLVTGDFTNSGTVEEYEQARAALDEFRPNLLLTPGNHDWGTLQRYAA